MSYLYIISKMLNEDEDFTEPPEEQSEWDEWRDDDNKDRSQSVREQQYDR